MDLRTLSITVAACVFGCADASTPDAATAPETGEVATLPPADASSASDGAPDTAADASPCPAGWSECSPGACVNTRTVAEHCGACGYRCANAGTCVGGECRSASGLTCPMNNADCDNNPMTGCEAQLRVDHTNCGTCGNDCTVRGLFCREGACAP